MAVKIPEEQGEKGLLEWEQGVTIVKGTTV